MARENRSRFTHLPNELLLEIFQYCSGIDIINAGEAFNSDKVWDAISNVNLWKSAVIGPPSDYRKYSKFLGKHTTKLTIKGTRKGQKTYLTQSSLSSIRLKCPELSHLIIENCVLDTQVIKFSLFPKTLTHLNLSSIKMANPHEMRLQGWLHIEASPFFCMKRSLPLLERLELCHFDYLYTSDSYAILSSWNWKENLNLRLEFGMDSLYFSFPKVSFYSSYN